jgi:hypothetical protein
VTKTRKRWRFYASLSERTVRGGAAGLGGALHETFELILPRFVRRSRLYEATAKNLLRVAIELVGGVEGSPTKDSRQGRSRSPSGRAPATSSSLVRSPHSVSPRSGCWLPRRT